MTDTAQRLDAVRAQMRELKLDAMIVPRADEYLGEYLPNYNERLLWISGFTGSAGVVVVLPDRALIFVDGRYTVQVRQQVSGDLYEFLHLVDDPYVDWLADKLGDSARIGYDPRLHPLSWQRKALKTLTDKRKELVALEQNLIDLCWQDRPQPEARQALLLGERFTGKSSQQKRAEIGAAIAQKGADVGLIFAADSVAWLLNIRGRDIPCLPVVLGLALLRTDGAMQFFTDPGKIPAGFADHVGSGVEVLPESGLASALGSLGDKTVLADPDTANAWCQLLLIDAGARLIEGQDPVLIPKACKNEREIEGMREAHIRDAVAEVRFLAWLDAELEAGRLHDEAVLADRLYACRAEQDLFQETSFDTISAAAGNAAMCHYNHLNGTPAQLARDSVYLVDSGGQYLDGTTDITRTIAIGEPDEEVRRMFTLVLKGHIALDRARFPEGTTGTQLDVLARQFLWNEGLDYDHGTGHGVGCYLSVHEGPQRIGKAHNGTGLAPGMVVSNEPGFYKADCYGMRCENLVLVRVADEFVSKSPRTLVFEALTLVPFDTRLVDATLMTIAEIEWLNGYHAQVRETIAPHLEAGERQWLENATRPLELAA